MEQGTSELTWVELVLYLAYDLQQVLDPVKVIDLVQV
jgi:hypothetical protein